MLDCLCEDFLILRLRLVFIFYRVLVSAMKI
jgi:hypothetical protein